ncbi:MAG: glycosyltransferase family 2 protein, partial [Pseudomonadota bacterium]
MTEPAGAPGPDLSVIIPTHDRIATLPAAVESVLAQRHRNLELIVVDDASRDATPAYLAGLADPRLRTLRLASRAGANVARNRGAAMARAPVLSFLDSDDLYHPHRAEAALAALGPGARAPLHLSSFLHEDGRDRRALANADAVISARALEYRTIADQLEVSCSGISIRQEAFAAVGGFDEGVRRLQDRDLLLRLARRVGAILTSAPNWTKRRMSDSMSVPRAGRIAAYAALYHRHPVIAERYALLFRHRIAHQIARPVLKFRPDVALRMLREAGADP